MPLKLSDKIYTQLKKMILNGEIKPGQYINETNLAQRFSVSRTPVREALSIINKEGYIDVLPNNGYVIRKSNLRELLELLYVRILLEGGAAYLAAGKITIKEINELQRLVEYPDEQSINEYNNQFHLLIAHTSGNLRLYKFINQILDEVNWILAFDHSTKIEESDHEHIRIIDSLRHKDAKTAMCVMQDHLEKTKNRIQENLSNYYVGESG